jgi:hypothetical protein
MSIHRYFEWQHLEYRTIGIRIPKNTKVLSWIFRIVIVISEVGNSEHADDYEKALHAVFSKLNEMQEKPTDVNPPSIGKYPFRAYV